jgi:hypothetical protein
MAFLPVPEEHGTAGVDLGEDTVLMSADAPRTAELFRVRGATGGHVAISEFVKPGVASPACRMGSDHRVERSAA